MLLLIVSLLFFAAVIASSNLLYIAIEHKNKSWVVMAIITVLSVLLFGGGWVGIGIYALALGGGN